MNSLCQPDEHIRFGPFSKTKHGWLPGHVVASHFVMHAVDICCPVAMFFGGFLGDGVGVYVKCLL